MISYIQLRILENKRIQERTQKTQLPECAQERAQEGIQERAPSNFFWNKINFTLLYFVLYPIGFKKAEDKSER